MGTTPIDGLTNITNMALMCIFQGVNNAAIVAPMGFILLLVLNAVSIAAADLEGDYDYDYRWPTRPPLHEYEPTVPPPTQAPIAPEGSLGPTAVTGTDAPGWQFSRIFGPKNCPNIGPKTSPKCLLKRIHT